LSKILLVNCKFFRILFHLFKGQLDFRKWDINTDKNIIVSLNFIVSISELLAIFQIQLDCDFRIRPLFCDL